jgi:L-rhamnose mutarotase
MILPEQNQYLFSRILNPSAAILLDVENFCLKLDLEELLKPYCQYPVSIKYAVANWQNKSLAGIDIYLHQQRYQLIHVPKEKNGADAQILTLGSSLLLNYPHLKEVVVVSHDSIFEYLHQTLQAQGCHTYKVYQQSGTIFLSQFTNNNSKPIAKIAKKEAKNSAKSETSTKQNTNDHETELKNKIRQTLKKLANTSENNYVALSQLCKQFLEDYNQSLAKTIQSQSLGKSPSKFIKKSFTNEIEMKLNGSSYSLCFKNIK